MLTKDDNQIHSAERIFFKAILQPHRSLSRFGFALLMGTFAIFMFGVGIIFCIAGAWPILGFCGVEFLFIIVMFHINYRAAHRYEQLRLSAKEFEVRQVNLNGKEVKWLFEPSWLQVNMDNPPRHHSNLTIGTQGRLLAIGKFLTPQERLEVAQAIRNALHTRWLLQHSSTI